MHNSYKYAGCVLGGVLSLQAAELFAQERRSVGLEEIIVTAQKREESLTDVPMSVSALSAETMENRQLNSLADLANSVPGLTYQTTQGGNPVYTIRGVGFYDESLGAYPSVTVYMDQIPLSFPMLSNNMQFDLERVEIIKGPQGTTFGQNATGGAINYIAAKPTESFDAAVELGYGRFNHTYVDAHVSGPVADNLKLRLAGRFENADGWQQSYLRDDENGEIENYMMRFMADYQPTDDVSLQLMLTGWQEKGETMAPQYIGLQPNFPIAFVPQEVLDTPFSPADNRDANWTPGLPNKDNDLYLAGLRADVDLSDNVVLTSITSYVEYNQDQAQDIDGLAIAALDGPYNVGEIETFSQELRLFGDLSDGAVRWLAGANYEHSEVFQANRIVYPEGSAGNGLGFLFGYPIDDLEYSSDQEMNNWAVFASGEFDITSNLSLTVGARYTETEREATLCSVDPGPSFIVGPFFYDVFGGGAFGPYTEGACFPINNIGVDYLPPGSPGEFRDKLEEDNVAWNISPKWRLNDDVLLYLTVSEGYKAGSYATLSASTFQQFLPITQESVMAYELGTKASFAEGRAQLNMAVFHYEYEDKQLLSKLSDVTFGLLRVLQNVPESTIDGVEIELTARPVEPIVFTLAGTYMDGKIDEFTGMNSGGVQADFSGSALPSTPEWQGSADIEYQFEIGGYPAYLGLSYSYRSEMASIVGGDIIPSDYVGIAGAPYMIDSYETVDVRAGITSPDERWSAKIWGKNILDEYYWYDTLQNTVDQVVRYPAMPATYGASIAYHFF